MSDDSKNLIFDIFKNRNLLSSSMQKVVQGFMDRWSVDAYRALIETNVVEESRMADVLAEVLKFPRLHNVPNLKVAMDVFEHVPYNLALEFVVFPFELSSNSESLKVVFANPSDSRKVQKLSSMSRKVIQPFVGEKTEIIAAIQRHYPLTLQLPSLLPNLADVNGGVRDR